MSKWIPTMTADSERLMCSRPVALLSLAFLVLTVVATTPVCAQEEANVEQAVVQAKSLSTAFRAAAKKVMPAVVEVKTQLAPSNGLSGMVAETPGGENLLGQRLPLGSGVFISEEGIVLTNGHVVAEGGDSLLIEMADGRVFEATDAKIDTKTDLAIVRIDAGEKLPFATLGDSSQLDIGDWVLAIGSPFDLDMSVSAGIISAKERSLGPTQRASFLQTDAAINPGNSGGPLVNLDGQVVGINTAIASRSGGYQGIGFAIPSNMAKWVVSQLMQFGEVKRAYLGVSIRPVEGADAAGYGVLPQGGVIVIRVFEDSPAAGAGLRRDDVILTFDGHPIRNANDLQGVVEMALLDQPHELRIVRDKQEMKLPVKLKTMPGDFGARPNLLGDEPEYYRDPQLGLLLLEPTEAMARRFGFDSADGLLIVDVTRGGPAHEAGVRAGMMITQAGETKIGSMQQYQAAMAQLAKQGQVALTLQTPHGERTITIDLP